MKMKYLIVGFMAGSLGWVCQTEGAMPNETNGSSTVVVPTAPKESSQTMAGTNSVWTSDVLSTRLKVGYSVRSADLNGDQRPDLVVVDAKRVLWLENPSWTEHVIWSTPEARFDNVCAALEDIDGDGDWDLAVGYDWQPNNTNSGGALGWLESPEDPTQAWTLHEISREQPTIHRMYWADLDGSGQRSLIVAPLKGRGTAGPGWDQSGVRLARWDVPASIRQGDKTAAWSEQVLERALPVMHNLQVVNFDGDKQDELLLASLHGVHHWRWDPSGVAMVQQLGSGHQDGVAPALGASEIRWGQLAENRRFLGTIEPWHGNQVVVYESPAEQPQTANGKATATLWSRKVVDRELQWGHAVACVNLDDDPEDELVIGVRDDFGSHRCGVRIYDRNAAGEWQRTLVQPGEVAVEDLIALDLDGDGRVEIVAVGRATGNVVIYRQQ